MFQSVKICPSILSADFTRLGQEVDTVVNAGAGFIHIDVMDGHFVPNLTMGVPVVKQLRQRGNVPLDVHLMIDNPLEQLPWFLDAGCDMISVHAETLDLDGLCRAVQIMHEGGVLAAVAIKPATPTSVLKPVIKELDMVLVMSVEPGFSGQSYIEGTDAKVAEVVRMSNAAGCSPLIQVDGGIGKTTAPLVCAEGADLLVCGNAVFAQPDPAASLKAIQEVGEAARLEALNL
ncbi:ribulose-phosphate 3-epimerase [Adlercreutzia sp. ZJ304]|uniref:ribulose-phosphate 3-epimerase n=1 Tax=Adlercreutzia sp. ZJ304 TaxID=2709791 RepID=UPI0013EAE50D|nr:ribulose-phosphate 3-epimerase [Adlercreutzia sp. ZJ304]